MSQWDKLLLRIHHLSKDLREDGIDIPVPDSLETYSGQFKLRIPRSLHRTLAEHSKQEGVSMNQYCVYLLSRNDARESLLRNI